MKSVFVVCCCFFAVCVVLCCAFVEIVSLLVVLFFVSMMFVFLANNDHAVRVIVLFVVSFEYPLCTVTCSSFLVVCILGLMFFFA